MKRDLVDIVANKQKITVEVDPEVLISVLILEQNIIIFRWKNMLNMQIQYLTYWRRWKKIIIHIT